MPFGRLMHVAVLAAALSPAGAHAQPQPATGTPAPHAIAPGAHGIELGAGSMILAIFPTVGGHVSVPASRRARVEVGLHAMPWLVEDGDDVVLVSQVQVRVPFRAGPPGSRRSLLLGATAFTVGDRGDVVGDWEFDTGVRPHAGVSWQWQKSRHLDVRIDLQGVFTGLSAPFVVPFATFSMVWHGQRGWS